MLPPLFSCSFCHVHFKSMIFCIQYSCKVITELPNFPFDRLSGLLIGRCPKSMSSPGQCSGEDKKLGEGLKQNQECLERKQNNFYLDITQN